MKGSTTSPDKLDLLKNAGIDAFVIAVNSDKIEGNIEAFLEKSEILIIDIPPKLRNPENDPSTALRNRTKSPSGNCGPPSKRWLPR